MTVYHQPAVIEPLYLTGKAGRLFSIFHKPSSDSVPEVGVLCVPPFADEMNRCRRQVFLQAQQFAAHGIGTLIVDLHGTGDSEGEFRDARWEIWVDDLKSSVDWLVDQGVQKIILLGVRLGALLAAELSPQIGGHLERVIFWQPVVNGKIFLTQFLRLRAAAEMMAGNSGMSPKVLRDQIGEGRIVEIAGYDLHPELALKIEKMDLGVSNIENCPRIDWFEISSRQIQSLSPAANQVVEKWKTSGLDVNAEVVTGELFWSTPEITVIEDLLTATCSVTGTV